MKWWASGYAFPPRGSFTIKEARRSSEDNDLIDACSAYDAEMVQFPPSNETNTILYGHLLCVKCWMIVDLRCVVVRNWMNTISMNEKVGYNHIKEEQTQN
eukprot:3915_1